MEKMPSKRRMFAMLRDIREVNWTNSRLVIPVAISVQRSSIHRTILSVDVGDFISINPGFAYVDLLHNSGKYLMSRLWDYGNYDILSDRQFYTGSEGFVIVERDEQEKKIEPAYGLFLLSLDEAFTGMLDRIGESAYLRSKTDVVGLEIDVKALIGNDAKVQKIKEIEKALRSEGLWYGIPAGLRDITDVIVREEKFPNVPVYYNVLGNAVGIESHEHFVEYLRQMSMYPLLTVFHTYALITVPVDATVKRVFDYI